MVDSERGSPLLGVILESVLFRQNCLCIVVETVLIVHNAKGGQNGFGTEWILKIGGKPIGVPNMLFHERDPSKRVNCTEFNPSCYLSCNPKSGTCQNGEF